MITAIIAWLLLFRKKMLENRSAPNAAWFRRRGALSTDVPLRRGKNGKDVSAAVSGAVAGQRRLAAPKLGRTAVEGNCDAECDRSGVCGRRHRAGEAESQEPRARRA